jgi:hypothetical protein
MKKLPFFFQVSKLKHFFSSDDTNVTLIKKIFYAQTVIYRSEFLSSFLTVSFRLIQFKLMSNSCFALISFLELFSFAAGL